MNLAPIVSNCLLYWLLYYYMYILCMLMFSCVSWYLPFDLVLLKIIFSKKALFSW